ncbi:uncharacterized protein N7479_001518 [Penicillium vulpinum]|uniref:AB hydrolase-1 domain-containing protein n=1 Tax=Penicillium vulpinum TaxID=29845 RepID=A0A1V6RUX1_9EURO|nr:uncharacterized protein N7479_001518 [Penicillium vulpinum]KAJ5971600.1 hypothetical protein N7479_001518 [Penicillium vulpinum]OQE05426.1 hypothetical protein PENVUL_c024G01665 [Penicillium vulpinum]
MYKIFSSDFFNFEFLRILGNAGCLGAESGECLVARAQIKDGDPESWYRAWTEQADKAIALAEEARASDDNVGASWAYLRAANYYRASEFFLHCNPEDPRLLSAITKSVKAFDTGSQFLDGEVKILSIPYENGASLPGRLFLPAKRGPRPLPLIVQTGGFDSTQEELYFYGPAGALPRGYAVLTFEGPGQGIVLRRDGLHFRPDWEKVTSKVLDLVEHELAGLYNLDMNRIAVQGASLGGYLALRAAADPRVRACISCDGCYDLFDITRSRMPDWFINGWMSGWLSDGFFNGVVGFLSATNFQLRWEFGHSQWIYGVDTPANVMRMMQKFTLKGDKGGDYLSQLKCSTLVTGAGDTFYFTPDINAQRIFDQLGHLPDNRKQLWIGKGADGGGLQAKIGSIALMHQKMFAWLDEQFGKP